ncbi:hypothetical protein [Romboutsia sp. MSSM.1001216sp_RTP31141st1_G3_RTP31141_220114]|uniref:hypothetical protein n=1 Tax=unclassified Romboutsia TaxID=2626894 RepID=UPI0031B60743
MNKKRNIVLSICFLLGIVGIVMVYMKGNDGKKIKSLKQVYFEMIEDDIKGEKITSDELVKNIENILEKDESFTYGKTEDEGNGNRNKMNTYNFENKNEVLEVSYLKNENNQEEYINFISYQLKKEDNETYIGVNYFKQKEDTYILGTVLYPDNLTEQRKFFNLIKKGKEIDEIYHMYYELAPYVEEGKSISVEAIENILGEKSEDIEHDTKDGVTTCYTVEKDKSRLTILYNKEENKIFFTSIVNDCPTNGVNVYCSEDKAEKESKIITMINKDLKEQETMIKDVVQSKK